MATQTLKTGTRIEMNGTPALGGFPAVPSEAATIARWSKVCGPYQVGWHIVRFNGGGELKVHESRFRVTDNRAAASAIMPAFDSAIAALKQ